MKALPAALFLLFVLSIISVPALADSSGSAVATVYVYDRPEITVGLTESEGTLVCSWDIKDYDENDSFAARVSWLKEGEAVSSEKVDCGQLRHCAALERPKPAVNEAWKCSVTVTDSFGAAGSGSAEFQLTPLGFFGGWVRALFSLFGLS